MELISREEAISRGHKRYFTGQPCKQGHIVERRVSNRGCLVCLKERLRSYTYDPVKARANVARWQKANPEKARAIQKRWRERHPEKVAAKWLSLQTNPAHQATCKARAKGAHKRRYQNPQYVKEAIARAKRWREANPVLYAEKNLAWRVAHPERMHAIRLAGSHNRRARMRAAGKLSAADVREVRAAKSCAVCGNIHARMEIDHIVPLSRGGSNTRANLQLLCRPCNRSKWAKDVTEWAHEKGYVLQETL